MEYNNVLALYDCRSKQEYIYRTNRIKEIMGASMILTGLFKKFFNNNNEFKFSTDWENKNASDYYLDDFNKTDLDGEIIYEGGGNLCIIYKDEETYYKVNRKLSKYVLDETFGVSIIASRTKVTGNFICDRKLLYMENAQQKNLGSYHTPCNVLPFTKVDRVTHQPYIEPEAELKKYCDVGKDYTGESLIKVAKYKKWQEMVKKNQDKFTNLEDKFDEMVDKGNESLLAIIYIDGNNMGNKLKEITRYEKDYTSGINALRKFSVDTNNNFVTKPIDAIKNRLMELHDNAETNAEKRQYLFRPVIYGGDEINIVCNARAVPEIIETYFSELTKDSDNSSCAGVAIFHSHAPFADVYEIAEQCCERGKEKSHQEENKEKNYIDFHFCHAGITNDLKTIRKVQEEKYTSRPYEYSTSWAEFIRYGKLLSNIKRSDVKALGEAIVKGDSYYKFELERIKSRDSENKLSEIYSNPDDAKKYIFDISIVYDLWFAKKGAVEE